jgi:uncharacterized protein
MKKALFFLLILFFASSCARYYRTQYLFNKNFERGNLEGAQKVLYSDKKGSSRNTKLLHYLNLGVINNLQGNYTQSNIYFEEAFKVGEDYRVNYIHETAGLIANPFLVEYKGEDHELLLIHYYKALNFLKLNDYNAALVEARRMNIKLNQLSDKYSSENKYKKDAFMHLLMGLIYDANGEYNNAFIAYRNAYNVYQEDYSRLFGLSAPQQLKQDLLRTAYLMNFDEDLRRYEEEFGFKYQHKPARNGEIIYFWNSGLGPVKIEKGIQFVIARGNNNDVYFRNQEYGMEFRYNVEEEERRNSLSRLEFVKVVIPAYLERPLNFKEAYVKCNDIIYPFQKVEDVNAIAFKSLQQRLWMELSKSLLRVALKKVAEHGVRSKNDDLGAAIGFLNFMVERADIRNWQSIPHSIYYARVPLAEGENNIVFETASGGKVNKTESNIIGSPGKVYFEIYNNLETGNMYVRY